MPAEQQREQPGWRRPPGSGYTVEDLFTLPDLPPHTELIDGGLVFMAPQQNFHGLMITVLETELRSAAPANVRVRRGMLVVLSEHTALEPDVVVVKASRVGGLEQATYRPDDVVLALEVVSPSSGERDRDTKPHKYAGAGIPYFWRVEREGDRTVVSTYELDDELVGYRPTGTHVNELSIHDPFPITIDLTQPDRM